MGTVTQQDIAQLRVTVLELGRDLQQHIDAVLVAHHPDITDQGQYSALIPLLKQWYQRRVLACREHSVSFVPYFPLESGLLTGKYRKGADLPAGSRLEEWAELPHGAMFLSDPMFDAMESLIEYAESRNHTILELGLSWLAGRPDVRTVIAGATTPDQVAANAAACSWDLGDDELAAIEQLRPA